MRINCPPACSPALPSTPALPACYSQICSLIEERPDVLLLAVNFDDNKTLVKALGVKVGAALVGAVPVGPAPGCCLLAGGALCCSYWLSSQHASQPAGLVIGRRGAATGHAYACGTVPRVLCISAPAYPAHHPPLPSGIHLCGNPACLLQVLPYFLFYRGKAGKLQEFSASLKRIQLLKWVQPAQQEGSGSSRGAAWGQSLGREQLVGSAAREHFVAVGCLGG